MVISFNISAHAVMQEIYAASALRSLSFNSSSPVPPILTRHNAPALLRLVKDAFAFVVMKFITHVEACNLNDESPSQSNDQNLTEDMILTVDIRVCSGTTAAVAGAMRVAIEHAVSAYALHIAYIGHDDKASDHYLSLANENIQELKQTIMRQTNIPHITPQY